MGIGDLRPGTKAKLEITGIDFYFRSRHVRMPNHLLPTSSGADTPQYPLDVYGCKCREICTEYILLCEKKTWEYDFSYYVCGA